MRYNQTAFSKLDKIVFQLFDNLEFKTRADQLKTRDRSSSDN